jgi:hypothetical protein
MSIAELCRLIIDGDEAPRPPGRLSIEERQEALLPLARVSLVLEHQ